MEVVNPNDDTPRRRVQVNGSDEPPKEEGLSKLK